MLWKLNASYVRRTRDLEKARSEVLEVWKVAEEQATEANRLKAEATSGALEAATDNDDDSTFKNGMMDSAPLDSASIRPSRKAKSST